jgi:LPXTG-site transpeptidase (sortase) family protein
MKNRIDKLDIKTKLLGLAITVTLVLLLAPYFLTSKDITGYTKSDVIRPIEAESNLPATLASNTSYSGLVDANKQLDFWLEIPKISLRKQVIENVDPASESTYANVITKYVAHGMYTRLPDEATVEGNVYLFAHRQGVYQGKNIGFFQKLDKLSKGDIATITYGGKKYTYRFKESFIVTPQDTWVYNGSSHTPTLTLQTCEDGENLRLIVKFDLVSVS